MYILLPEVRVEGVVTIPGIYSNVKIVVMTIDNAKIYAMVFSSGLTIKVGLVVGMLTIEMVVPGSMEGTFEGLMGNFNKDPTDDLNFPNGTQLANGVNSTEEELFYFGQTCKEYICKMTTNKLGSFRKYL